MLWADGVGAEVIGPMAAPVLGGLLVADEVIDLFLPLLFYRVRRWRWERLHGRPRPGSGLAPDPSDRTTCGESARTEDCGITAAARRDD